MMIEKNQSPSIASHPDLDWSQVRETVRMLHLTVAQIDMSLREGDDSIQTLSSSFTSMTGSVERLLKGYEELISKEENNAIVNSIKGESEAISNKIQESIVAFQFYDKLSQRLAHVSHALAALADLVNDQGRLYNPREWTGLQGKIRSHYSMREEQEMFDLLLAGGTIEDALSKGMSALHELSKNDAIELF
jgi:Mg2+ and Co2+ transporter CorA